MTSKDISSLFAKNIRISPDFRWFMSRRPISRMRFRTAGRKPSPEWSRCLSTSRAMRRVGMPSRVNVLPGCHLTPGDIDELRTIIEDFGLEPSFLPDLGGSLDGHIPDEFTPTTIGGNRRGRSRDNGLCVLDDRDRRTDAPSRAKRWRRRRAFLTSSSIVCAVFLPMMISSCF